MNTDLLTSEEACDLLRISRSTPLSFFKNKGVEAIQLDGRYFFTKQDLTLLSRSSVKVLKFADLFAGIGGFHIALHNIGAECVFASEYDKYARLTYYENFKNISPEIFTTRILGESELFNEDINHADFEAIPDFDILCAGFPCQPFSLAGVSKKKSLGKKHGFQDEKQGNLFFTIMGIVDHKRPPVLFLENVKNLKSHDQGRTWKVIEESIRARGYKLFCKTIDGRHYVPQHRERIFIVCFDEERFSNIDFVFPDLPDSRNYELSDIIEAQVGEQYTLSDKLWNYLQLHKKNSAAKGNGFGYGLVDLDVDTHTRTMSARYYKDGSEILIKQTNNNPRKITPKEAARLLGFPDTFKIPVSDTQAYKQFGNSIIVPVVVAIAKNIVDALQKYEISQ